LDGEADSLAKSISVIAGLGGEYVQRVLAVMLAVGYRATKQAFKELADAGGTGYIQFM
jgi:hypothetical protein